MARAVARRRLLVMALAASLLFALPAGPARAAHPVKDWVCDYRWSRSTYQLKRLIRCAARRWIVPGGPTKALSVARCESNFDPRAYAAGNAGVYQQRLMYWPARSRLFGFPGISVYNGRANVIVSMRMAHGAGWDAWACA